MSAGAQGRVHDEPAPSRSEGREGERAGADRPAGESDRAARLAEIERLLMSDEACYGSGYRTIDDRRFLLDEVRALQAQLDAAREDAARYRRLLEGAWVRVQLPSDTPVQYVGVYALRWGQSEEPTHGFHEIDVSAIDAARAAAAPRGEEGALR